MCICELLLPAGLGTSSILGGAIMAALWKVTGQDHSKDSLIHAVRLNLSGHLHACMYVQEKETKLVQRSRQY